MFGHQDSSSNNSAAPVAQSADGILNHPVSQQTLAPTAGPSPDLIDDQMDDQDISSAALGSAPMAPVPTPAASSPAPSSSSPKPATNTGLLELKQAALHDLSPLLDHLEQTAEEKFRTMMMMIQASDDQAMLADAYHAAQSIEDKKIKAQALLDVDNEINYFTQQQDSNAQN